MTNRIMIKNISTATVVISVPEINFRRELSPRRAVPLTRNEYDDLVFDPGFNALVRSHYILVTGVEEDKALDTVTEVYDVDAIRTMFENKNYSEFAKFIASAAQAEKDSVVQIAVDNNITDNGFSALIKKYCGIDVISAINTKHLAEEK